MKVPLSKVPYKKPLVLVSGLAGVLIIGVVTLLLLNTPSKAATVPIASVPTTITALPTLAALRAAEVYPYANVASDSAVVQAAATRGAITFRNWCDSCHPNGQVGYGPALWGNGIIVSSAAVYHRVRAADERERERFSQLAPDKLNDIIAYIQAQERASNGK